MFSIALESLLQGEQSNKSLVSTAQMSASVVTWHKYEEKKDPSEGASHGLVLWHWYIWLAFVRRVAVDFHTTGMRKGWLLFYSRTWFIV